MSTMEYMPSSVFKKRNPSPFLLLLQISEKRASRFALTSSEGMVAWLIARTVKVLTKSVRQANSRFTSAWG